MANAEPEAEEGGGGAGAALGRGGGAARVAPLGPEQLRRVLEQVSKAQPPPPPFVLQDAARRLRDAARQAALQRGPGAEPPPRLLPPQQLEAIRVKVTSGETQGQERRISTLATLTPRIIQPSPAPRRSPGLMGLSVTGPQLLRLQPLLRTSPQPSHLSHSPQPPIQVLVRRPLPSLSPVSVKTATAPRAPGGQGPPALPPEPPSSTSVSVSNLHTKHMEKRKTSLHVKTRSGRISRPPKYKAKDYRFIKTEDLADGHPSDSDDYSELSVEEDEGPRDQVVLFDSSTCPLRPKTFKCQACDKSYIGQGGLARHFKLNPGHGQLEPTELLLPQRANRNLRLRRTEDWPVSRAPLEASTPTELREEGVLSQGATAAEPTQGRWQGDPEGLAALARPRRSALVTVFEFLLMKVKRAHVSQPLFPAVYKEFEELHRMVEEMCHDYLSSSGPCPLEPLEIRNSKVAESLGITEEILRERAIRPDILLEQCASPEAEAGVQKREGEPMEEALASVKRARGETIPKDTTGPPAVCTVDMERLRSQCAPAAREGCGPQVNRDLSHLAVGAVSGVGELPEGRQLRAVVDFDAQSGPVGWAPLPQGAIGPVLHAQLAQDAGGSPPGLAPCGTLVAGDVVRSCGSVGTVTLTDVTALFPEAMLVDQACRTASEPPPGLDRPLPATRSLGSHMETTSQCHGPREPAGPAELESIAAGGEAGALELSPGCQELFSPGPEQILIQTSDGLLLSHPSSLVPGEEDIVLVAEGTGVLPAGLPLEAVEALLGGQPGPSS
ncbi:zinc finger protein 839 isoform X2 [Tenrec ecaudatus]|uniref:zinc finger protein 839 isoform X2 n=1 Tax=Tenrec ecaudatus TaxID=94439 RepID=UPI003F5A2E27